MLRVKRIGEPVQDDDGIRILIDRTWPLGLSTIKAHISEWAKDLAPSDELRWWFVLNPEGWKRFRQRYIAELSTPQKAAILARIASMASSGCVTLLFDAPDAWHNAAKVIEEVVSKLMSEE